MISLSERYPCDQGYPAAPQPDTTKEVEGILGKIKERERGAEGGKDKGREKRAGYYKRGVGGIVREVMKEGERERGAEGGKDKGRETERR